MSYTGVYSQLYALEDGERTDRAPKILDEDAFYAWPAETGILDADTFRGIAVTDEWTDSSTYPTETWSVITGFKSYTPRDAFLLDHDPGLDALRTEIENHRTRGEYPLGYDFNIDRIAAEYNSQPSTWVEFYRHVSEHTESFAVYHSPINSRWPALEEIAGSQTGCLYYLEGHDGDVYVEKRTLAHTSTEVLVDDADPVAAPDIGGVDRDE